jgi:hypothetical protein
LFERLRFPFLGKQRTVLLVRSFSLGLRWGALSF